MVLVEVFDHIFIGDVNDARNIYLLIKKNIGGVVSCFAHHQIEWCCTSETRNNLYYKNDMIKCKQDLSKCSELTNTEVHNKEKENTTTNNGSSDIDGKCHHDDFVVYTSEVLQNNTSAQIAEQLMHLTNVTNEIDIDFTKESLKENKTEEHTTVIEDEKEKDNKKENEEEKGEPISKSRQVLIDELRNKEDQIILNNTKGVLSVNELNEMIQTQNKITYNNIFKVKHLTLDIQDTYNENLIIHVSKAHTFIDQVLSQNKNVLVHCFAGISRCSSIILSYISKKNRKGIAENLRLLRLKYPFAYPNQNFYSQLLIYEQNDYDDKDFHKLNEIWSKQNSRLTFLDHLISMNLLEQSENPKFIYRCKFCRILLFSNNEIVEHDLEIYNKKKSFLKKNYEESCTSIFIKKPRWLPTKNQMNGIIYCPNFKCKVKLGKWSWKGLNCSCGYLQFGAFMISMSNVDKTENEIAS